MSVRVTYDAEVDAAYIYLAPIGPGEVGRRAGGKGATLDVHGDWSILLDYDKEGRLRGIEVIGASKRLPATLLEHAERL